MQSVQAFLCVPFNELLCPCDHSHHLQNITVRSTCCLVGNYEHLSANKVIRCTRSAFTLQICELLLIAMSGGHMTSPNNRAQSQKSIKISYFGNVHMILKRLHVLHPLCVTNQHLSCHVSSNHLTAFQHLQSLKMCHLPCGLTFMASNSLCWMLIRSWTLHIRDTKEQKARCVDLADDFFSLWSRLKRQQDGQVGS